jgi:hypothetical protein
VNYEIKIVWNDQIVLKGKTTLVMAYSLIKNMANEFGGNSRKDFLAMYGDFNSMQETLDKYGYDNFDFDDETGSFSYEIQHEDF